MTIHKNHQFQKGKDIGVIGKITTVLLLALALTGCAHSILKGTLKEVDKGISYENLRKDAENYKGKTVLLGGVIINTENKKEGTLLEIYQTGLDCYGEPINTDVSQGRFLAMYNKFLDSEIYRSGRKVTVVGVMQGVETMKLDEIDYDYPYLMINEIHLWKEEQPPVFGPYYRDYWGSRWWDPWYQWYYPYGIYQSQPKGWYKRQNNSKTQQQQKGNTTGQKNTRRSRSEK